MDIRDRLKARMNSFKSLDTQQKEILKEIPLDQIYSETQVRKVFENLDELANSMKELGQLQPIVVAPANSAGQYLIQQGERRWRAAKLAGLPTLKCVVQTELIKGEKRSLSQLAENIIRNEMQPMEIARAFAELEAAGMSKTDIAKNIGMNYNVILLYGNIMSMPKKYEDYFVSRNIRDVTTMSHICRAYKKDPEGTDYQMLPFLNSDEPITRVQADKLRRAILNPEESAQTEEKPSENNTKAEPKKTKSVKKSDSPSSIPAEVTMKDTFMKIKVEISHGKKLQEGFITAVTLKALCSSDNDVLVETSAGYIVVAAKDLKIIGTSAS